MAKETKTKLFYVTIGAVKWAWRAKTENYKGLENELGVKVAKDTDDNIVIGANFPSPPRMRLNLADGTSVIRICDPSNVESILSKNTLNGKKTDGKNINSVSIVTG